MQVPWSRAEKLVFAGLAVAGIASLFVFVHPWYDARPDASLYLLTARALAAGEGYSYLQLPFLVRPPGFSLMISPLVAGDGPHFGALNALVSGFGVASLLLLFVHLRPRVGALLSALTAAALWLNPGFQTLCNQVMSDVPGLAGVLACLVVERWAARRPSSRRDLLLGLAIGVCAYLRSAAILLVPAILLARIAARMRDGGAPWPAFTATRLLPVAGVALAVLLPWSLRNELVAPPPPAEQTLNYSIATALLHEDPGDPRSARVPLSELASRPLRQASPIASVLGSRMKLRIPRDPQPADALERGLQLGISLLLLAGLGVVLWRRREPAELFAAASLLVIVFYFSFVDRLLLPVFVLGLAASVEALRDGLGRWLTRRRATLGVAAALLALIAVDLEARRDWARIEAEHEARLRRTAALDALLPERARLASMRGYHHQVFLDRPVYNLVHAVRRAGRMEAAEEVLRRHQLDTVLLEPGVPGDRAAIAHFQTRYGPGRPAADALVWELPSPGD